MFIFHIYCYWVCAFYQSQINNNIFVFFFCCSTRFVQRIVFDYVFSHINRFYVWIEWILWNLRNIQKIKKKKLTKQNIKNIVFWGFLFVERIKSDRKFEKKWIEKNFVVVFGFCFKTQSLLKSLTNADCDLFNLTHSCVQLVLSLSASSNIIKNLNHDF